MTGINSNRLKEMKEEILIIWEERCLKEVISAEPEAGKCHS